MKFVFVLCLLLASSCFATVPHPLVDFSSLLSHHQAAMRALVSTRDINDDSTLINTCFNNYMSDQTEVVTSYNKQYNGCVNTAQSEKNELTAQSATERTTLLDRSNSMCQSLSSCDELTDGLEFFDCYRNASMDSYKTMFTLNSDASQDFNYISAKYNVIETDLTACVEEARVDYAHNMDTCNEDLNTCLAGGVVPTAAPGTTEASVTDGPSTDAPISTEDPATGTSPAFPVTTDAVTDPVTEEAPTITDAPVTGGPTTQAPVTDGPTTEAPVSTDAPVTGGPTTEAPVSTDAPVTGGPTTEAPVSTDSPVTGGPTTEAPVTDGPTTEAPVSTDAPVTGGPTTEAPITDGPTTEAPVSTDAPVTGGPTTEAPVTDGPTTEAPVTDGPTTEAPVSTDAPVTGGPTTEAPVTDGPTTEAPVSTDAPKPTTEVTDAPSTDSDKAPEEDLGRAFHAVEQGPLRRLFKRFF